MGWGEKALTYLSEMTFMLGLSRSMPFCWQRKSECGNDFVNEYGERC